MPILHTVNKSPFNQNTLSQCLDIIGHDHSLILIEDGAYGALKASPAAKQLSILQKAGLQIYALSSDLEARGLSDELLPELKPINMSEMVELCCQHTSTQSWY